MYCITAEDKSRGQSAVSRGTVRSYTRTDFKSWYSHRSKLCLMPAKPPTLGERDFPIYVM
jgi:hypothetical protein